MYLVELRPGKEELYRSSDELALAIRSGDVDARSRVYHRVTAKWISITLHPQYKAIVAAAKEDPIARPSRRVWGLLGGTGDQSAPPSESERPTSGGQMLYRWRRPLALGVSALLLMSGIQLAFSGPRPPWANGKPVAVAGKDMGPQNAERNNRSETLESAGNASGLVTLASNESDWTEPDAADTVVTPTVVEKKISVLPQAPKLRSNSLGESLATKTAGKMEANSLEAVFARYAAAHDSARSRLETGMRVARLNQLFALSRLTPDGGVTDTRMSLAGAANFIRVYRQQQMAIEKAYQDTVVSMARQQGWSAKKVRRWFSRPPRKEAPTLELLSGSLLASIDSVLSVLAAQAGAYKLRGTAIAFEDPAAGQTYGSLRRLVKEQIDAAIAAGGATSPGVTGLLLRAIGTSSLPRET
jgi:hypothetical protein